MSSLLFKEVNVSTVEKLRAIMIFETATKVRDVLSVAKIDASSLPPLGQQDITQYVEDNNLGFLNPFIEKMDAAFSAWPMGAQYYFNELVDTVRASYH